MKRILMGLCLICLFTNSSCGNEHSMKMSDLVLKQESIDQMSVYENQSGTPRWTINDQGEIREFIRKIKEIPVEKLSKDKDIDFMEKGQKLMKDGALIICFFDEEETVGNFIIWPDGQIYANDIESMKGNERTVSYLSNKGYPEIYESLINREDIAKDGSE